MKNNSQKKQQNIPFKMQNIYLTELQTAQKIVCIFFNISRIFLSKKVDCIWQLFQTTHKTMI